MHISAVHDYDTTPHDAAAKKFLDQRRRDGIRKEIEQILSEEYDKLEEDASEHITRCAASRAEAFLERVLKGDKDAALALINPWGDRYRASGCDTGEPWAHLIHGRLFQTNTMELREQIVKTHQELFESERIKDLESIVDGLTRQVRELEKSLDECRRRY